ncbi:MAG: phytoene synthase [Flavobacteriales bacterium]|nr:phytoene synthase [Flavobacteriales bacterium]|tara:strand:+ start:30 stop:875 length:846 start_codon:yes stop_codon:yes gene_type:complete
MLEHKDIFDQISKKCSEIITRSYSTSFSFAIKLLDKKIQSEIHSIYGYVRLGDEIVDSFHSFNKIELLSEFKQETFKSIKNKISLNPVINNFQRTVNKYEIDHKLIKGFIRSMEFDLNKKSYNNKTYEDYITGSARNVGLMCLKIFCNNNQKLYDELSPYANALGSAFQKINFLRDFKDDNLELGRTYFPNLGNEKINNTIKKEIEKDIDKDFNFALIGIRKLPKNSKLGVFIAYNYYWQLYKNIRKENIDSLLKKRIRIPNPHKIFIIFYSYIKVKLLNI